MFIPSKQFLSVTITGQRIDEVWCATLFPNGYKNLRSELYETVCMQNKHICTGQEEGVVMLCDVNLPLFPSAKSVQ